MFKIRYGILAFILAALGTLSVNADELDWKAWQKKFNRMQAEKESDPARASDWKNLPVEEKEVEVTATLPL